MEVGSLDSTQKGNTKGLRNLVEPGGGGGVCGRGEGRGFVMVVVVQT